MAQMKKKWLRFAVLETQVIKCVMLLGQEQRIKAPSIKK